MRSIKPPEQNQIDQESELKQPAYGRRRKRLKSTILDLHSEHNLSNGKQFIFQSEAMRQVMRRAEKYAPWECDICILGERGTGKEQLARLIHDLSGRRGAWQAVNCAAMPLDLIESILFGHNKGAFTGAINSKRGYCESAEGGTLFLDEIGDLPLAAQGKILRTMQERTITRVGSVTEIRINTRIIAATNQNLHAMTKAGSFRSDLFDRFKIKIIIPSLREHPEDIPLLAAYFLECEARKMKLNAVPRLSLEGEKKLLEYSWPGNVRELENVIYMALVETLPGVIISEEMIELAIEAQSLQQVMSCRVAEIETLDDVKMRQVLKALQQCGGSQAKAAKLLGITRQAVSHHVKKILVRLDL